MSWIARHFWLQVAIVVALSLSASGSALALTAVSQQGPSAPTQHLAEPKNARTLVVGSEQEYPPFSTGMTDATAGGFTVDLWKAVATELGLNYAIRVLPFHQLLKEFREGKIDVLINLAQSDERRQFADFSIPHVTVHGALFVRDNQSAIRSESDLAGKSLIVVNADAAQDYAVAHGWGPKLVAVDTAAEGLRLLASGRHDAMLLSQLTGLQTLQKLGLSGVKTLPVKIGFSQKFAFATQRGQTELLARINEELAITKANHSYDALYEQWFGGYEVKAVGLRDVLIYLIPVVTVLLSWGGYMAYRRLHERNLAAAAIAESRDLLLAIIDTVPVRVFWKNSELRYLGCNAAFARDAGMTHPGEVIGKDDFQMAWADQAELYRADDHQVMKSGMSRLFFDEPQTTPDGKTIWVRTSKVTLKNAKQETVGLLGIYEDVTERKGLEEEIKASEVFKNAILNSVDAEIAVLDHEGVILAVNDPWRRFARENSGPRGVSDPSVETGANYLAVCEAVVGPESSQARASLEGIRSVLNGTAKSYSLEYPCHSPDIQRWFKAVVLPLGHGSNPGVVITHTDITDQVKSKQEAAAALIHLQKIASRVPGMVFQYRLHTDGRSCLLFTSDAIHELFRVSPDAAREDASRVLSSIHPDDYVGTVDTIRKSGQTLTTWQHEFRVRFDDGTVRWLMGNGVPEREVDESVLWHGFITDITERRKAEETLRKLSVAVEQSPASVVITDMTGAIEYVNPQFTRVSGYSTTEVIGANPRILQSKQTNEATYLELWQSLSCGQSWHGEFINRRKNGELYWEESHISPIKNDAGSTTHYVAIKTDISERVRDAEKIATLMQEQSAILNNDLVGIITVRDRKFLWVNPAFEKMLGHAAADLAGVSTRLIYPSAAAFEDLGCVAYPVLSSNQPYRTRFELVRKDGTHIWVDVSGKRLQQDTGDSLWIFIDITHRIMTENRLIQSEAKVKGVLESAADAIFITDRDGCFQYANERATQMLDYSRDEFKQMTISGIATDNDQVAVQQLFDQLVSTGTLSHELRLRHKNGYVIPVDFNGAVLPDGSVYGSCRDISERKKTEKLLRESEAHLKAIFETEPECIKIVDAQGLLVQMNPAGLAMIEADSWAQVKGLPVAQIIAPEYREAFANLHARVIAGETMQMEFEVIGLKGGRRWLETSAVPMKEHSRTVHLGVTRDITQRKLMEGQVRHLAFHDPLTGLPNRRLMLDRLNQAMVAGKRSGCCCALMFLDLDKFKSLNDTHGHEAGDQLLQEVARRLTGCVREVDTVARFGGDEFVVLLGDLVSERQASTAQTAIVAEKIRVALQEAYVLTISKEGGADTVVEHHCTASIGVAVFIDHEASEDDIFKWADAAMYQAKDAGGNTIRFHDF